MNVGHSYSSVTTVLWLLSMFMIGMAGLQLFGMYVLPYLHILVVEVGLYGISWGFMYSGQFFTGHVPMMMATTGCLLFLAALSITCSEHVQIEDNCQLINVMSLICAQLWGWMALLYESRLIGFLTVVALYVSLFIIVSSAPLTTKASIPIAMMASLVLVGCYVYIKLCTASNYFMTRVFGSGILFMGPLVFFMGCLIVSSTLYYDDATSYLASNVLTIVTFLACFFLGHCKGLENLYSFACIMGMCYVLEKYLEIPWDDGWALGMLGVGVILYAATMHAHVWLDKVYALKWE